MFIKIYKNTPTKSPISIKHSTKDKILIINSTSWDKFLSGHDRYKILSYIMIIKNAKLSFLETNQTQIRDIFLFKSSFSGADLKGVLK